MAKGYWVSAYHSVSDQDKLAAYAKLAAPAVEQAGGKFLARSVAVHAFEAGVKQRTVIVEFASVAAAVAAHESAGYQAALKALHGGAIRDLRIVEGA